MTQETSAANRVLDGLEQPSNLTSERAYETADFFRSEARNRNDDLLDGLDLSYMNNSEIAERDDDQDDHNQSHAEMKLMRPVLDDSFRVKPETVVVEADRRREPLPAVLEDKSMESDPAIAQVEIVKNSIIEMTQGAEKEALRLFNAQKGNMDFNKIALPFDYLERLFSAENYCAEDEVSLGKRQLVLRKKDQKGFSVFSVSNEGNHKDVPCYLAHRDVKSPGIVAEVRIVDNSDEDYSLVLCIVKDSQEAASEDYTLIIYKVTEDLSITLLDYEFGFQSLPKKIVTNKSWFCISDHKDYQVFRLLHAYDPFKLYSEQAVSVSTQSLTVTSRIVNLESAIKPREVDISSLDGLLLVTYDKSMIVVNSQGFKTKLQLPSNQTEDTVCARFLGSSGRQGQPEYLVSLELSQGHIISIVDRNIKSFKTQHVQTFEIPIGQGGPKGISFEGTDVFLSEDLLIVFFHGDFYFVCFHIEQNYSGSVTVPSVRGTVQANLKPQERSHQIRFLETDLGKVVPVCVCKNFQGKRVVYRLEGLLGGEVYSLGRPTKHAEVPPAHQQPQEKPEVLAFFNKEEKSLQQPDSVTGVIEPGVKGQTEDSSKLEHEPELTTLLQNILQPERAAVSLDRNQQKVVAVEPETRLTEPEHSERGAVDAKAEAQEPEVENASESDDEEAEEQSRKSQDSKQESRRESQEGNSPSESCHEFKDSAVEHAVYADAATTQGQNQVTADNLEQTRQADNENYDEPQVDTSNQDDSRWAHDNTQHIEMHQSTEVTQADRSIPVRTAEKPQNFDMFIQNAGLANINFSENIHEEDKESTHSMPVEITPTSEPVASYVESRKDMKTHSVTPSDHAAKQKPDLNQLKNSHAKKPEKVETKKRGGKSRNQKEVEPSIHSRKVNDKDKQRNDKYIKEEFVPKESVTVYREKEPKEEKKTKDFNNYTSSQQSPERGLEETEYVRKVKDNASTAVPHERLVLRESKSHHDDKRSEAKDPRDVLAAELRPMFETLLEAKLESLDANIRAFLEKDSRKEDALKNGLRDVIESLVDEKLIKVLKENFNCLMSNNFNEVFEELVVPTFEKYFTKVFDKTNLIFEKGMKFYCDKLSIEERKATQLKDQFSVMMNQFLANSKAFSKATQEFAQISKEVAQNQHKEINARLTVLEEKMEKFADKQDKMFEMMEKIMVNQQKSMEEDKKIEVPPAFKESSPNSSLRDGQSTGAFDHLSDQIKSLLATLQMQSQSPYAMPPQAPTLPTTDLYRSHPGAYIMPQNPVAYSHSSTALPQMAYPYMNQQHRGNSFSSSQHSVGSTTPMPPQMVIAPAPAAQNGTLTNPSDNQIRDLILLLSKHKEGDRD